MSYMLDTNICIYIIKEKPAEVLARFNSMHVDDICISCITESELFYGVNKSLHVEKNLNALQNFLTPLNIAAFDEDAAVSYGNIRATLEKKGEIIGSNDLLIAAHALAHNKILVTNNIREFSRVPNLILENWIIKH